MAHGVDAQVRGHQVVEDGDAQRMLFVKRFPHFESQTDGVVEDGAEIALEVDQGGGFPVIEEKRPPGFVEHLSLAAAILEQGQGAIGVGLAQLVADGMDRGQPQPGLVTRRVIALPAFLNPVPDVHGENTQ